jgi:hypothetical protein
MSTVPWPDLFASALVGTARGGGDAEALLDTAAVHALRRRAGVALVPAVPPPDPAPIDDVVVVGPAAAARADALLALDYAGRDATPVRDLASRLELLAEWLAAAVAAGRRLPAEQVPALLDAGRRHRQLRPLIAPVAGPLAGWLAAQRPEWSYASAAPPEPPAVDDHEAWELGTIGRRVSYLRRLRGRDPARARELIEAVWDAEPPEHRAALLPALATGLSLADEPLLERALDDRRRQVRDVALELLAGLPDSGYGRRMVARAGDCVHMHGSGRVEIRPPATCDRAMRRDGIAPRPPAGRGERAWWLEEILARTPLLAWPEPEPFLGGVDGEWAPIVRRGLARAAVTQCHSGWAAALVEPLTAEVAARGRPDDRLLLESLYQVLPADDLAALATAALHRGLSEARAVGVEQVLSLCPRPWPPAVARAVYAAITEQLGRPGTGWRVVGLCELAALGFPAIAAPHVTALVGRLRTDRPGDPGLAAAERLAATVQFRHAMLEELANDQ